jgi:hypothetical protein
MAARAQWRQLIGRLKKQLKRPMMLAVALMLAMPLAGCGMSAAPSAKGISGILGDDLLTARGATRDDQRKIDKTLEAGISAGIWSRPQ